MDLCTDKRNLKRERVTVVIQGHLSSNSANILSVARLLSLCFTKMHLDYKYFQMTQTTSVTSLLLVVAVIRLRQTCHTKMLLEIDSLLLCERPFASF